MNCPFCNKNIPLVPNNELNINNIYIYFCEACNCELLELNKKIIACVSLFVTVNSKLLRYSKSSSNKCNIWSVNPQDIHSRLGVKIVTKLPDGLNLNPTNLEEKIKMFIVFS